jgi:hypothetical protein
MKGQNGAKGRGAAIAVQHPTPMREPIVGGILGDAITRNGDGAALRVHHHTAIRLELVARGAAIVPAAARHTVALPVLGVVLAGLSLMRLRETQACSQQRTRQGNNDKPHEALSAHPGPLPTTTQRSKRFLPRNECEASKLTSAGKQRSWGLQNNRLPDRS